MKIAQNHGIAVGRAMAGIAEQYADIPWYWTDQHGITIQVAGLPHEAATTVLRGQETANSFCAFHLDPAGRLNPGKVIPTLQRCAEYGKMHVKKGLPPFAELERF